MRHKSHEKHTGASDVTDGIAGADDGGVGLGATDEDLEGSEIENVLALHLAQKLSTLQTSGLVQVSGGGTGGGTGTLLDLDLMVATYKIIQGQEDGKIAHTC